VQRGCLLSAVMSNALRGIRAHLCRHQRLNRAGYAAAAAVDATRMSAADKYLFDLNGYIVVRGVFNPDEVAGANAAIDARLHEMHERSADHLRNTRARTPMAGDGSTGRLDLGRCLEWPSPDGDVFRRLLAHPVLLPYFTGLCGVGYRMDHLPLVLAQDCGAEGFMLHGGVTAPVSGDFQPHLQYSWRAGTMHNMLLGCTLQLVDHEPGDGGFCIVRGSHKANFAMPSEMVHGAAATEHIYQPATKAGDVVLFSEAATHGALPWARPDVQRRVRDLAEYDDPL
jgi:ectoine hydroxylase-related dioxygenase (phytanoyl-CoA dioxygenase family)